MIFECSVNLENKTKQELIIMIKEAQKIIMNQQQEINQTQAYILVNGIDKPLKTATQIKIEHEQNRLHLLEIERYRNIIKELREELENWKFTTKYVENNYISKDKIRKIIDDNLKNTKINPNGYCFSFEGCQKVSKEIFELLGGEKK